MRYQLTILLWSALVLLSPLGRSDPAPGPTPPAVSRNGVPVSRALLDALDRGERVTVTVLLKGADDAPSGLPVAARRAAARSLRDRTLAALGVEASDVLRRFDSVPAVRLRIDRGMLARLKRHDAVARIDAPGRIRVHLAEGRALIGADDVHAGELPLSRRYDGTGQVVAVIDSGIDYTHPSLGGCLGEECKVVAGHDFVNGDEDPMDDHGHGTAVAGIIASESEALPGVAPGARLVALKVIRTDGWGSTGHMNDALDWVAANGPDLGITLVNLSSTGDDTFEGACDDMGEYGTTTALIDEIHELGIAVLVSSGNGGCPDRLAAPACVTSAISVGAVYDDTFVANLPLMWVTTAGCDQEHTCTQGPCCADGLNPDDTTFELSPRDVMCLTNSGPALDLLAPAYDARTLEVGGGTKDGFTGTSAAAPYAAGAAALLLEASPGLTPEEVREILATETDHFSTDPKNDLSFPVVDAFSAVRSVDGDCECADDDDCGDDAHCEACACVAGAPDEETADGGADGGGEGSCGCRAVSAPDIFAGGVTGLLRALFF